jgi:hypothetical protein
VSEPTGDRRPDFEDKVMAHLAEVERMITEYGWSCQGVFATEPDKPTWVYTIGLERKGHPELLVVMPDPRAAQGVLNTVAEECMEGRQPWPEHGQWIDWALTDPRYRLAVVEVERKEVEEGAWFNIAAGFRADGKVGLRVLQLVWPDQHVKYPDGTWKLQPVLGDRWWEQ